MGLGFWFEFLGLIAYLLSWATAFSIFLAIVLAIIGVVWSPFAAFWCARVARGKGLSARSYAVRGGVYSALFFLPWVYLTLRMAGKSGARAVATGSYWLLYAIWFVFVMFAVGIDVFYLPSGDQPEHYRQTLFGFDWGWINQLIDMSLLAMSVYLWVSSLRKLRRRSKGDGPNEGAPLCTTPPDWAYLTPLWYGILNTAILRLIMRLQYDFTFKYDFFM